MQRKDRQPLIVRGESARLLGQDAVVQALLRMGLPLTRENYLDWDGDDREMTAELEASLPEEFQLSTEGDVPPEVVLEPGPGIPSANGGVLPEAQTQLLYRFKEEAERRAKLRARHNVPPAQGKPTTP